MAHIVFLRASAADLTAGKPPLAGVPASAPLSAAAAAIPASSEAAVAVWRVDGASHHHHHRAPTAAATVVGLLSSIDVVAFLANHPGGAAAALIEIVELMKRGARRVLVGKNIKEGCSINKQPFAPFYKAVLKITGTPRRNPYCCLTREDIVRFLINCLGALAPIPMQSIASLGAISRAYSHVEDSSPAIGAAWELPSDPRAVAVVRTGHDGSRVILGEISGHKLWKKDYAAAAEAMATMSAMDFATGVDESGPRKIGFSASLANMIMVSHRKNRVLTCKATSSLAAVMAQMLSHRATHLWVVEDGDADKGAVLVGMIGYMEILRAVTRGVVVPPA
ncbi:CBS domain-containing protein CBSX6-like [Oryza glaberrima]|uniref:CBS domain-containing protein CBSX6-like n=1 Tax=Oryza glaberrima TaxID=4538 RepID=UPI00224C36F9|nr:CBS domain-containing protein CBSX6-like [Oryza glaberrima]